ncbi:hypothetical protein SISNIDRAFT_482460 [Sistotremastrum niveocremeum HHB9708]|uniref:Uncharacterized protein n=1 Tax=Sistotremastrum niveocremeum HHB9708 TaxID=1314777 RepID=A0A164Y7T1_9AGAM|nr:hypothetical protein SISNIDRAFT_482460 [Sistotremastrum niveocremeum HHB9708]
MVYPPNRHSQAVDDPHPPPGPVHAELRAEARKILQELADAHHQRGINTVSKYNEYFSEYHPVAEFAYAHCGVDTRELTMIFFSAFHEHYKSMLKDELGSDTFSHNFAWIPRIHHFYECGRNVFPQIAVEPSPRVYTTLHQHPSFEPFNAEVARRIADVVDEAYTIANYDPITTREHLTRFRSIIMDHLREEVPSHPFITSSIRKNKESFFDFRGLKSTPKYSKVEKGLLIFPDVTSAIRNQLLTHASAVPDDQGSSSSGSSTSSTSSGASPPSLADVSVIASDTPFRVTETVSDLGTPLVVVSNTGATKPTYFPGFN